MRTPSYISIQAAILATMFAVGCSKSPLPPNAHVQELGEIELTVQTPKRVPLGEGKELVVATTLLPDGRIQLDLEVEPKPTDGRIPPFKHAQFTMRPGDRVETSLGDRFVRFVPRLQTP
jgi:hypothetical protein